MTWNSPSILFEAKLRIRIEGARSELKRLGASDKDIGRIEAYAIEHVPFMNMDRVMREAVQALCGGWCICCWIKYKRGLLT